MISFFGIKGLRFSQKQQYGSAQIFFQDLRENTCSFQPALKNSALGL